MTPQQLYNELNYVDHSREKRQYYANLVIDNTDLVPLLLDILFQVNDPISCRAAWVFEFMCSKKLEASLPYLDTFTNQLHTVHRDSAIRPVAKVCEYLVTTYYNQPQSQVRQKQDYCIVFLLDDKREQGSPKSLCYELLVFTWFGQYLDTSRVTRYLRTRLSDAKLRV